MLSPFILTVLATILLLTRSCSCARVEFYADENYNGFVDAVELNSDKDECYRVNASTFSVKTERCVMLYDLDNCQKPYDDSNLSHFRSEAGRVFRVDGNLPYLSIGPRQYLRRVNFKSFHVCSQERRGGPEVNVDILVWKSTLTQSPAKLEFRNVCACRNIPHIVVKSNYGKAVIVDSYGHQLDLFTGEHCTKGPRESVTPIYAHFLPAYNILSNLEFSDYKSFRPADVMSCMRLEASIHKFRFMNGSSAGNLATEQVKVVTDTVLRANGDVKLTQEVRLEFVDSQTLDFTTSNTFSSMHGGGVEARLSIETEAKVPLIGKSTIKAELAAHYKHESTTTDTTSNTESIKTEETLEIKQIVEVPACNECVISAYVKRVNNFVIKYEAYMKITGTAEGRRLTAAEIKPFLQPTAKYLRDWDAHTVEVVVTDVMYAKFGISSLMDATCTKIRGCGSTYSGGDSFRYVVEVPVTVLDKTSSPSTHIFRMSELSESAWF